MSKRLCFTRNNSQLIVDYRYICTSFASCTTFFLYGWNSGVRIGNRCIGCAQLSWFFICLLLIMHRHCWTCTFSGPKPIGVNSACLPGLLPLACGGIPLALAFGARALRYRCCPRGGCRPAARTGCGRQLLPRAGPASQSNMPSR